MSLHFIYFLKQVNTFMTDISNLEIKICDFSYERRLKFINFIEKIIVFNFFFLTNCI
jgi:hypothetical protein